MRLVSLHTGPDSRIVMENVPGDIPDEARGALKFLGMYMRNVERARKSGNVEEEDGWTSKVREYTERLLRLGITQQDIDNMDPSLMRWDKPKPPQMLWAWVPKGTKFDGNTFVSKKGKRYQIDIKKGSNQYTISVRNERGYCAGVTMNRRDDGTYWAEYLKTAESLEGEGLATAMYDYFSQYVAPIVRSGDQTDEGKIFWGSNKSQDALLPKDEQIERAWARVTVGP